MKNRVTKIVLAGEEYNMHLDIRSEAHFRKLKGISLAEGINNIIQKQDIESIGYLLFATCRYSDGKSVPKNKMLSLDIIEHLPIITDALTRLLSK